MGDEFYAIIKLVSGEEIFSMVCTDTNEEDTILLLHHPVIMNMIQSSRGSFIKVTPWMEMTDDDMFAVKLDKIITMTETNDKKLIQVYKHYIDDIDSENDSMTLDMYKSGGKVNISNKMGYISSVEEARDSLEKIFNINKEN
jgi:hypothetical protein|tara:strand:+ start:535 stop:960 length:426 start_codon:yes stop_codon:yes gene_type:complete